MENLEKMAPAKQEVPVEEPKREVMGTKEAIMEVTGDLAVTLMKMMKLIPLGQLEMVGGGYPHSLVELKKHLDEMEAKYNKPQRPTN